MADESPLAQPPGPDVNAAPKLLAITGSLYLFALILFCGRIYTRIRRRRLGWDDYTIAIALVIALAEWSLLLASVQYGVGRHNYYVHARDRVPAQHLLFASTLPWAASIMFIKISIACMLLRIKHTTPWRVFLWMMIAVQILSCFASLIFELVQCVPLAALWDPAGHPRAACAKPSSAFVSLYVNSGIGITTDLIFAFVPISFIRKMHCPLREKLVLSCLMGLGVFAAAASIVKTTLVKNYGRTGDTLWDAVDLTLWSVLEEQTGIIAACIPCLKSPFERTLHRFGILEIRKGGSGYHRHGYHSNPSRVDSHQLPPLHHHNLSLKRNVFGLHPGIGLDTNLSSTMGKSTIGRSTAAQSEETIWPSNAHAEDTEERDQSFRQMMAEGGILLTTEFQVKSEAISRAGSIHGEEGALERERERELEEWRVERPSADIGRPSTDITDERPELKMTHMFCSV